MEYTTDSVFLLISNAIGTIVGRSMTERSEKSGEVIEFGPQRIKMLPYTAINELQQVRTTYDADAIEELAQSIQSGVDGSVISSEQFELANPLLMGRHSPTSAKRYIAEHGDYYHIAKKDRIDVQDLTPFDDDSAIILIGGHRRRRAIGRLLEMNNITPINARVASSVRDEIEFGQAIGLQLRENVYERPSPQDEARAIDLSYRYNVEKLGHAPNIKKLAQNLGFSEKKVRGALTFASLPASIQEYTSSGALSYTIVCQLKPLYDAYFATFRDDTSVERGRKAELSVREFCDTILKQRLAGKSDEKLSKTIANRAKEIQGQADYQQLSFDLLLDDYSPERRANIAGRQLAATAISVMRYRLRTGEVKDDEIRELETLLAAHRLEQAERQVAELPLGLAEAS